MEISRGRQMMIKSLSERQGSRESNMHLLTATNILSSIKADLNIIENTDSQGKYNLFEESENDSSDNLYEPCNLSDSENENKCNNYLLPMWNANAIINVTNYENKDNESNKLFTGEDGDVVNVVSEQEIDFEKADENVDENVDQNDENDPPTPIILQTAAVVERKRGDKSSKKRAQRTKFMKPPCKCTQNCIIKISEERRKAIHEQYWENSYAERGILMKALIDVGPPKRKRSRKNSGNERTKAFTYHLSNELGERIKVCQIFFLNTLGISVKVIVTLFKDVTTFGDLHSPSDKRGKHPPKHKISDESKQLISDHIMSFNPSISHYRRKHAPRRLYLPPELNVRIMYDDFKERYPNVSVHYVTYTRAITDLRISFAKLGLEECETCIEHDHHQLRNKTRYNVLKDVSEVMNILVNNVECQVSGCEACVDHEKHVERAGLARDDYRNDNFRFIPSSDEVMYAVDMQKVVMLPRIPGVKRVVFTRRIVGFNMTFAPIGGKKGGKPVGVIWHEAMCGRNDEDVTSTYVKIIRDYKRDCHNFIFWADNCSAQNKNWTFYTTLCQLVNDPDLICESITIKYFEPGHTFMAADAFHKQVEDAMRNMKQVLDFKDFENCISNKGVALNMTENDFFDYKSKLSHAKNTNYPYLDSVVVVQFQRGSRKMFWKTDIRQDHFSDGEFLQKKFIKVWHTHVVQQKPCPRGIPQQKKADIIKKLCPLMESSRRQFWYNLPTADVPDLATHDD